MNKWPQRVVCLSQSAWASIDQPQTWPFFVVSMFILTQSLKKVSHKYHWNRTCCGTWNYLEFWLFKIKSAELPEVTGTQRELLTDGWPAWFTTPVIWETLDFHQRELPTPRSDHSIWVCSVRSRLLTDLLLFTWAWMMAVWVRLPLQRIPEMLGQRSLAEPFSRLNKFTKWTHFFIRIFKNQSQF